MKVSINRLTIANFKGIKSFELANLNGGNIQVRGANGAGKTTIFDAYLWLLFGKDSTGREDFELRPLNDSGRTIPGLDLTIEAEVLFDGEVHILKKKHNETIVKGVVKGGLTTCWIDEVPKLVGEYNAWIAERIPKDTFRILADLHFFNKQNWKDRRKVLIQLAGDVVKPEGFQELIDILNGRTMDEYKKVLAEQKKGFTKDRAEIGPRIDEIQKALPEYAEADTEKVIIARDNLAKELEGIKQSRKNILSNEAERQKLIGFMNIKERDLMLREVEIRNESSGNTKHREEKDTIEKSIGKLRDSERDLNSWLKQKQGELTELNLSMRADLLKLDNIRAQHKAASEPITDIKCTLCGQDLPEEMRTEPEKKRLALIADIVLRGNEVNKNLKMRKARIAAVEAEIETAKDNINKNNIMLDEAEAYKKERYAAIEVLSEQKPEPDFKSDSAWKQLQKEIFELKSKIGEPPMIQLDELDVLRKEVVDVLASYNKALSQVDQAVKSAARIEELKAKEIDLSQAIANVDRLSALIDEYKAAESTILENAVNSKFKYVKFKLFSEILKGGTEDTCDATLNGVPYDDISCGQKIIVDIDIINVLSEFYGLSVALFIDNSESLTLPIEAISQVIELYADPTELTLKVFSKKEDKRKKKG